MIDHHQQNSNERIDQALASLRTVEIPSGMEQRILQATERHAARAPVRPPAYRAVWVAALAGTAVICLTVAALHRTQRTPITAPSAARIIGVAKAVEPSLPQAPARALQASHTRRMATIRQGTTAAPPAAVAVSYPAPPMPLTEQERLLLRIVHKGDPVQMAMLDPMQRAARTAAEKADFQQFFEPSLQGETK